MKTTNTIIDVTTDRTICSNAGTLLVADTANTLGVAEVFDKHLDGLTPSTITHTAGTVTLPTACDTAGRCSNQGQSLGSRGDSMEQGQ